MSIIIKMYVAKIKTESGKLRLVHVRADSVKRARVLLRDLYMDNEKLLSIEEVK